MTNIIYRPIARRDYAAVEQLISDSFGLHRYVSDSATLSEMKHSYIYSCLAEATFTCVAERSGQVVGVIMGQAAERYHRIPHLYATLQAGLYLLRMRHAAKRSGSNTDDYANLHRIYHDFLQGRTQRYDGVLTLFAVNESCRGMGIGRTLLGQLESYYQTAGVKRVYLYTDSTCNTGFYDSHGFQRALSRDMSMTRDGQPMTLSVYLYEKEYTR